MLDSQLGTTRVNLKSAVASHVFCVCTSLDIYIRTGKSQKETLDVGLCLVSCYTWVIPWKQRWPGLRAEPGEPKGLGGRYWTGSFVICVTSFCIVSRRHFWGS